MAGLKLKRAYSRLYLNFSHKSLTVYNLEAPWRTLEVLKSSFPPPLTKKIKQLLDDKEYLIACLQPDLSTLKSVQEFAEEFLEKYKR